MKEQGAKLKGLINKYIDSQQNEFAPSNDSDIIDELLEIFTKEDLEELGFGEFIKEYFADKEDNERLQFIKLAVKYYISKTDDEENGGEDIADYTVHDALFDASKELGMDEIPDYYDGEGYYACLVEDVEYELGID